MKNAWVFRKGGTGCMICRKERGYSILYSDRIDALGMEGTG
jgi:hypothetical protein